MSLVYGYEVKSYDDHLLAVARKMAELGGAVLPGSTLVNELPFCKTSLLHAPRATDQRAQYSETYPRVDPVAEL